jgi:hypothetical protein
LIEISNAPSFDGKHEKRKKNCEIWSSRAMEMHLTGCRIILRSDVHGEDVREGAAVREPTPKARIWRRRISLLKNVV